MPYVVASLIEFPAPGPALGVATMWEINQQLGNLSLCLFNKYKFF